MFKDLSQRKKIAIGVGISALVLASVGVMIYFFGYKNKSDSNQNSNSFSASNAIARSLVNQETPKSGLKNIVLKAMNQQEVPARVYDDYDVGQLKERVDYFIDKSSLTNNQKNSVKEKVNKTYNQQNPEKKQNLLDLIKILRLVDSYHKIKKDILPKLNYELKVCEYNVEAEGGAISRTEGGAIASPLPYATEASPRSIENYSPSPVIASVETEATGETNESNSSSSEVMKLSIKINRIMKCILEKEVVKVNPNIDIIVALFLININNICISRNIPFSSVMEDTGDNKWLMKGSLKTETQRIATNLGININLESPIELSSIGAFMLEYFKKIPLTSADCELCKIRQLEEE